MNALPPLPPPPEPAASDRSALLPDTVRSLYSQTGVSLAGNLLGAVVLAMIYWDVAPRGEVYAWVLLFFWIWALRLVSLRRYAHAGWADASARAAHWQRVWNIGAMASGAAWGLSAWLFYNDGRPFHQTTLLLIIYSFCVGAIPLMASQMLSFLIFISLCFVPTIVRIATHGTPDSLALAGVLALVFAMTALLGRIFRRTFDRAIELKVRTEKLAQQLQVEKTAADEAKRAAEIANRAKTQFFAAASHDLRQPLHAMGLFAEALRARTKGDDEVLHLVNSINSSVDALEGLFGELLDITKIDTGGVEPRPEHFTLRELFQRLKLQYEPTAFEKGLALRFAGMRQVVHGDPVLVDRIVRNLLSNAIRYTDDGGVLVSARRRGDSVQLQVWDTGVGIALSEQPHIFDEFYQVQAHSALEPHHPKGLGLGLAIVQRLARLMGAPLSLSSIPGRGTVFTLTLPVGKAPRSVSPLPGGAKPGLGLTLEQRFIVVVEDEPAVREGLVVLLRGWGATVEAFDTLAAVEAWVRGGNAAAPDLAIVDYRLPEGHNGVEALRALRGAFSGTLPGIVVTGSTMSGHEEESSRHDFHLLVKPVAPNKLRAMIAFKLGLR
ncbi:ATP-binding protein [uncultured Methylibium sp.]|uniref:ATP-binding protein n=1 Tax=uncultured Methylibium sp. TaxID=381093 RepID=UPI0025ED7EB3|nr:ATP-binding protein [uncultured Methylibium sp.]